MRGIFFRRWGERRQIRCRLIILISEHPIQQGIRKRGGPLFCHEERRGRTDEERTEWRILGSRMHISPPIKEYVLKIQHLIHDLHKMQIVPLPMISPSLQQQADQDTRVMRLRYGLRSRPGSGCIVRRLPRLIQSQIMWIFIAGFRHNITSVKTTCRPFLLPNMLSFCSFLAAEKTRGLLSFFLYPDLNQTVALFF